MPHRSVFGIRPVEGFGRGRGKLPENNAHWENVGIQPGDGVWATVTEIDPNTRLPINGEAFLTVQQVAWSPLDGGVVDVSLWIDNVPKPIPWRCSLFVSREMP